MKKKFVLILIVTSKFCFSQDSTILDNLQDQMENRDTIQAIKGLELFRKNNPNNYLIYCTNDLLADLYFGSGQLDKAQLIRLEVLWDDPRARVFARVISTKASNYIHNTVYISSVKAEMCVKISKMFINENNFDSALYYLKLADDKFLPFRDCGNGVNMYRSYLSLKFSDVYLKLRDTMSSIHRLLHYFMNTDGDAFAVTKKLKEILLRQHSQEEITNEVYNAINNSKTVNDRDMNLIEFTLFGETLRDYHMEDVSPQSQLRMDRYLHMLATEQDCNSLEIMY